MEEIENIQQTFGAALRIHILSVIDDAQEAGHLINRGPGGREMALCVTNLQQALHWFDDALSQKKRGEEYGTTS